MTTDAIVHRGSARWLAQLRAAAPALLFGLRTAAAVSIALAIAFELELDNAYWAGTTAAIVCQPVLGSALRKALFRMAGTLAGAVAAVVLFACFPQDRVGFTLGFAGWCALCCFVGSRLTFFAAYGAMLAGYTAAIITGDVIDQPGQVFEVALARLTEVELGIAVATVVLATTQFGGSRVRLATALQDLANQAARALLDVLRPGGGSPEPNIVRDRLGQLAALAQTVDQVVGEAVHWRFRLDLVRAAQDGLFACHAETQRLWSEPGARPQVAACTGALWDALPRRLRDGASPAGGPILLADIKSAACAMEGCVVPGAGAGPAAARVARALLAVATALEVSAWLAAPDRPEPAGSPACPAPPDPLPALVNAVRAYAAIAVAAVLWMVTRWPNGPGAISWTAIPVLLMSPLQEKAHDAALGFSVGTLFAAGLAAFLDFAVLPQIQTFAGLAGTLALALVPMAALTTRPGLAALLAPAMVNFVPLVSPANQQIYDPQNFYNSALAIVVGCAIAAVALRALPPLPLPIRARRILAAAALDGDAVAADAWRPTPAQWRNRMRTRAAALPVAADPAASLGLLEIFAAGDEALRSRAQPPTPEWRRRTCC